MADSFWSTFSPPAAQRLADPGSYGRGLAYAVEGKVENLTVSETRLTATVRGALPYAVQLWVQDGEPRWSCECPVGEEGAFCKHCVAVVMAHEPLNVEAVPDAEDDGDELAAYVSSLDAARLARLVLEQAAGDWRLRERLAAEAAMAAGTALDLRPWERRIEAAFATGDFVEYREAAGWARDVQDALDGLAELLDAGHADAVVILAERAHRLADAAAGYVDDSDGWLADFAGQISELHLQACAVARPHPVALARRLVELELSSELDTFHRAAARYAAVLGEAGVAEYRGLLEPRAAAIPERSDRFSTERFRVTEALIGTALASGDPDQLIAVKAGDLHSPYDYEEVARGLVAAGREDEALDWAERGLAAHGDRPWQTPSLRELAAHLYRARGSPEKARETFWSGFTSGPSLATYRRLLQESGPTDDADATRRRVVAHLRERLTVGNASTLVEILLYEGDVDEAWQVAADHGCDRQLWMSLARARERTHPQDAIGVYDREIDAAIDTKKAGGYREAVNLLSRTQRLYNTLGRPESFAAAVAGIRAEHGRKRSLMALLDQKRW